MAWKKASSAMVELLENAIASFICRRKVMFGYPAYFANDNMFVGLFEDTIMIRLSDEDRKEMLKEYADARPFEPMPGRPMREYLVIPEVVYKDGAKLDQWLERSYRYALSIPPKKSRKT